LIRMILETIFNNQMEKKNYLAISHMVKYIFGL
jgi:hypothetical protein